MWYTLYSILTKSRDFIFSSYLIQESALFTLKGSFVINRTDSGKLWYYLSNLPIFGVFNTLFAIDTKIKRLFKYWHVFFCCFFKYWIKQRHWAPWMIAFTKRPTLSTGIQHALIILLWLLPQLHLTPGYWLNWEEFTVYVWLLSTLERTVSVRC